jgi:hypothetical protein
MQRAIAHKSRSINPRTVKLDKLISELSGDVEVIFRWVGTHVMKGVS